MTYKEVFDSEVRRTPEDLYKVRFHKEGVWWKSYEWSVYLYINFMIDIVGENKKTLKIVKKYTKQHDDGSIVKVGMPIEAFENFLPDIDKFEVVSDNEIVYDLSKHNNIADRIGSFKLVKETPSFR